MQSADSLVQEAFARHREGDLDAARQGYEKALTLDPNCFDALQLLGVLGIHQADYHFANIWLERALVLAPTAVPALLNHALVLQELGRSQDALVCYDKALEQQPQHAAALNGRGLVLNGLGREEEAYEALQAATLSDPSFAEAAFNFGTMLERRQDRERARLEYERALSIDPGYVDAMYHLGILLLNQRQTAEGMRWLERVLEIDPGHRQASNYRALVAWQACDWRDFEARRAAILGDVAAGIAAATTFQFLSVSDDPKLQRILAKSEYRDSGLGRISPALVAKGARRTSGERLRIAYVSGDFREHAVSYLTAGLFELHDRSRFEILGVSYGPNTQDAMYRRVSASFDRFIDIAPMSDREAAAAMQALGVDIAVDLAGATQNARPGIFAYRAAPIQINFLGFPGTGYPLHDYIIADDYVIPQGFDEDYVEACVRMPDVFQANDHQRQIGEPPPSRKQFGIDETAFVFCAFHANSKINPQMFSVWMRLLQAIDDSILWLAQSDATTRENLRREAAFRGVSADRLHFADVVPYAEHLARVRLADLALDTFPFNGGTTTSDFLFAGLPVVTLSGKAFAARMSGSLLRSVGLEALIASDLGDYERLALELARDRSRVLALRHRLVAARTSASLFDTARFTVNLEEAYRQMARREAAGARPATFYVDGAADLNSSPPKDRGSEASDQRGPARLLWSLFRRK